MSDATESIRLGYDRWAPIYDRESNPLQALEGPIVRSLIGNPAGLATLDLGCGTGRHSLWLAAEGAAVTALDFSPGMLAAAQSKPDAEKIKFLVHDLKEPLPFAAKTFDLLVSGLVLEHLPQLDPFFAEAHRVLKPGGRAVISNMHPAMFLKGAQASFTDPASGELVMPESFPHSLGAFAMAAVRAGFSLTDIREVAPDEQFAAQIPRAARYVGWPMLLALSLTIKN